MDLIKSGRYMYIDIFYDKTCATTKISTVAGYHVVLATLLYFLCNTIYFCESLSRHIVVMEFPSAILVLQDLK